MIRNKKKLWMDAKWPAPKNIKAGVSMRMGGYSKHPYNELNLSLNVGDNVNNVKKNRDALLTHLNLPNDPIWLEQTHDRKILSIDDIPKNLKADASYTTQKNRVCVVTTADCVPILLCDTKKNKVAAIHAGWRGICKGIIEDTIKIFSSTKSLIVWIGPCISQEHYQVSKDVYYAFLEHSKLLESAFKKDDDHWHCSLSDAVKITLINLGINQIYESGLCTYQMHNEFFSYRRDGETGRIATMIWIN